MLKLRHKIKNILVNSQNFRQITHKSNETNAQVVKINPKRSARKCAASVAQELFVKTKKSTASLRFGKVVSNTYINMKD